MKKLANHLLAALLTLGFLPPAILKLVAVPEMVENFARWGFPSWFMYVTGLLELTAAVLIVIPRTRAYGAALLVAVMVGAVGTHLSAGEAGQVVAPLVLGVLSTVALWMNRQTLTAAFAGRATSPAEVDAI